MRPSESKIREAILHPIERVREAAVEYFARSNDETIMPLAIESVEKFGREHAFHVLVAGVNLAQTPATVEWLVAELAKPYDIENNAQDNYRTAVAQVLCKADVRLVDPKMADLPSFPAELKTEFLGRIELAGWDWDALWAAIQELDAVDREQGCLETPDVNRLWRILEAMSRFPDKASVVLDILQKDVAPNDPELIPAAMADLAGMMRLEAAAPRLVEWMFDGDVFAIWDQCCYNGLLDIGGDATVRAIAERWSDEVDASGLLDAASLLGSIHTDSCAQTCHDLLSRGQEPFLEQNIVRALLDHFDDLAIKKMRQLLLHDPGHLLETLLDDKYKLVVAATIAGQTFPEYQDWFEQAEADEWGRSHDQFNLRATLGDSPDFGFEDEDLERAWEEDEAPYDEEYDEDEEEYEFSEDEDIPSEPIKNLLPPVGRNDPCPCGSGKKYKKCCLSKDRERRSEEFQ